MKHKQETSFCPPSPSSIRMALFLQQQLVRVSAFISSSVKSKWLGIVLTSNSMAVIICGAYCTKETIMGEEASPWASHIHCAVINTTALLLCLLTAQLKLDPSNPPEPQQSEMSEEADTAELPLASAGVLHLFCDYRRESEKFTDTWVFSCVFLDNLCGLIEMQMVFLNRCESLKGSGLDYLLRCFTL